MKKKTKDKTKNKNIKKFLRFISWVLITVGLLLSFGAGTKLSAIIIKENSSHLAQTSAFYNKDKPKKNYLTAFFNLSQNINSANKNENHNNKNSADLSNHDLMDLQDQSSPELVITRIDQREQHLVDYLERFDHPLKPERYYAKKMLEIADAYKLDYRFLPAIAMIESTMCKKIPKDSHNCFGYGVYGGNVIKFENYEAGFERVAKSLKERYIDKGLTSPESIETRYAPSSQGNWSSKVTSVMNRIQPTQATAGAEIIR